MMMRCGKRCATGEISAGQMQLLVSCQHLHCSGQGAANLCSFISYTRLALASLRSSSCSALV
eukprot:31568_5